MISVKHSRTGKISREEEHREQPRYPYRDGIKLGPIISEKSLLLAFSPLFHSRSQREASNSTHDVRQNTVPAGALPRGTRLYRDIMLDPSARHIHTMFPDFPVTKSYTL